MGGFFAKLAVKRATKITEHDLIVLHIPIMLQMKQQRDKLNEYKRRIEEDLETDRNKARKLLAEGRRETAKLLLKKKRFQDKLLEKNEEYLGQVDMMIHNVEFSNLESQVVQNLKLGNECLKKLNQLFSLDDVEKIMDDTREGAEYQKEISDLLSQNYTQEDEREVLKELDNLVIEQTAMNLPNVPAEPFPPIKTSDKNAQDKVRVALRT